MYYFLDIFILISLVNLECDDRCLPGVITPFLEMCGKSGYRVGSNNVLLGYKYRDSYNKFFSEVMKNEQLFTLRLTLLFMVLFIGLSYYKIYNDSKFCWVKVDSFRVKDYVTAYHIWIIDKNFNTSAFHLFVILIRSK